MSVGIVPVIMDIIQLDNNDGARDLIRMCVYNNSTS